MSRIRRSFLRKYNSLIAWSLSVFGIACTNIACEYGTPEGKFIVNGTVQSEEASLPLDHIRVVMGRDTGFSDAAGHYQVSAFDFPTSQSFYLNFTDVDGSINGSFHPKDTLIQFNNPEFHDGNGHWYNGETEKKIDVRLKAKE